MDPYLIGAVTAGAAAFRGITGFGYALVAALGLAGSVSSQSMVPFILVNDLMLTAFIMIDRGRSPIDWPVAKLLLVGGLVGAIAGSLLAAHLNEDLARILLSCTIALAAGTALVSNPPAWLANKWLGLVIGTFVGVLLGAFAVGGPLIAAWMLAGGTKRDAIRGTLAVFFGVVDLFSFASRVFLGTLGDDLPSLLIHYAPLTFGGFACGYFASRLLPNHIWTRFSAVSLVVIAVAGLLQTGYALFFA